MILAISFYLSLLFVVKERRTIIFHQKYQPFHHSLFKKQSLLPFVIMVKIIGLEQYTQPTDVFGNGTKNLKPTCARSEHRLLTWRRQRSSPLHSIIRSLQEL